MKNANVPKGWHLALDTKFSSRKEALDQGLFALGSAVELMEYDKLKVIKRGGKNPYYLLIRENSDS